MVANLRFPINRKMAKHVIGHSEPLLKMGIFSLFITEREAGKNDRDTVAVSIPQTAGYHAVPGMCL